MEFMEMQVLVDEYKQSGKTLPCTAINQDGDDVIISEGLTADNIRYYRTDTLQSNDWDRVTCYYEDGTITETYER